MFLMIGTRKSYTRLWRAPLLLATAGVLLLAACDSGDEEMAEVETPAATAPTEAPTEAMTETPAETTPAASPTEAMAEPMDGSTVSLATEGDLAPYLVDGEGMTLYLFTNDEADVSNCSGDCLVNWPPLLVEEGMEPTAGEGVTGELGVIERTDGGRQVTYNGMPLYYWQGDQAPGDTTGHEVGDVWFVVSPDDDMSMGMESTEDDMADDDTATGNTSGYN
ncbi:MAG: hypothetical protein WD942_09955 [Dehalococcoidia bacterium]